MTLLFYLMIFLTQKHLKWYSVSQYGLTENYFKNSQIAQLWKKGINKI